jgi:hypothetical protein
MFELETISRCDSVYECIYIESCIFASCFWFFFGVVVCIFVLFVGHIFEAINYVAKGSNACGAQY